VSLRVVTRPRYLDSGAHPLSDVKAALLYADEVELQMVFLPTGEPATPSPDDYATAISELNDALGSPAFKATVLELDPSDVQEPSADRPGADSLDVLTVGTGQIPLLSHPLPRLVTAGAADNNPAAGWAPQPVMDAVTRRRDMAELRLAAALLAALPAFPDARMSDILEAREELTNGRTRFRAAMTAAGRELADVPADEFEGAVQAYSREHVDPALQDIREELAGLRKRWALLRALREPWAGPPVASLAIGAVLLDAATVAAVAGSRQVVALAAREVGTQRDGSRKVRQQPFWYLHDVDRRLR
jgi:hypothetical protein